MYEQRFRTDILPLKDKLFRLALRITLDRSEAEDITQETLIRLWQHRDEWDQIQSLEAYALTICRRLSLDHTKGERIEVRGDRNDMETLAPADDRRPDEQLDQRQRVAIVHRLIDQLPETQRTIMLLRDIEGYRYDEIAQATGLTETQVKVYLHRARKKIREQL